MQEKSMGFIIPESGNWNLADPKDTHVDDTFHNFAYVCTSFWFATFFRILFNVQVCGGVWHVCESVNVHACVFNQRPKKDVLHCPVSFLLP